MNDMEIINCAAGCDDYLTFSLHSYCQEGNLESLMQKLQNKDYNLKTRSFFSGKSLLEVSAEHGKLDIFRWIIANSCNLKYLACGYYSLTYVASREGLGKQTLILMKYIENINYEVVRYIFEHCTTSTESDDIISLFIPSLDGDINEVAQYYSVEQKSDVFTQDSNGWNLLHLACLTGNLDMVMYITKLKSGIVQHTDKQGNSPLHLACISGNVDVVKYLIPLMGDTTSPVNFNKQTVLHFACLYRSLGALKVLCSTMKDCITWSDNEGCTPLHLACKMGCLDTVKYLSKAIKCDTFFINNKGFLPLHVASQHGHSSIVKYMVTELHKDVMYEKKYIHTALSLACNKGCLESVKVLLDDVIMRDNFSWKCLSCSFDMGHEGILNYFIDNVQEDKFGHTAFHYACSIGHVDLMSYLVNHNKFDLLSSINAACCKDDLLSLKYIVDYSDEYKSVIYKQSLPLLSVACEAGSINMVKFLVDELDCDTSYKLINGRTLLHIACIGGHRSIVEYLVQDKSCDLLCPDKEGVTPFHLACQYGHLNIIKYSSDVLPSLHVKDNKGHTELHKACMSGQLDVVQCLTDLSKMHDDFTTLDRHGHTALHVACTHHHLNVVKYLISKKYGDYSEIPALLHLACEYGYHDIVSYLVIDLNYSTASSNSLENLPLHPTCSNGHLDKPNVLCKYSSGTDHVNKNGQTLLHQACQDGNLKIVKFLVKEMLFDVNKPDNEGQTPLHVACQNGHFDVVTSLVNDFKCNTTDLNYSTASLKGLENIPLLLACSKSHLDKANILCKNSSGIDHVNKDDQTLLHQACCYGNLKIVKFLFKEMLFDANKQDNEGKTPLHMACQNGHFDVVTSLVNECNCNVNCLDANEFTPLHIASSNGHLDIVTFLCKKVPSGIYHTNQDRQTSLHLACQYGHLKIVKYLSKEMCDIEKRDSKGFSPFHTACQYGHCKIVKYLVTEETCVVTYVDKAGFTPLLTACSNGHLDIVSFLCMTKPFLADHCNNNGQTLIHLACQYGHLNILQYLIKEVSFDVEKRDTEGYIPLHTACEYGHLEIVKYLVSKRKVDLSCINKSGYTLLQTACSNDHLEIVTFLCSSISWCGDQLNSDGNKLLHLICQCGNERILEYLINQISDKKMLESVITVTFYASCQYGQLHILKLLKTCYPEYTYGNNNELQPLHVACTNAHLHVVRYLISELGFDVDATDKSGSTAFHLACQRKNTGIVKYMTNETDCIVAWRDFKGLKNEEILDHLYYRKKIIWSILAEVFKEKKYDLANLIIESFETDPKGDTALHFACDTGHQELMKYLAKPQKNDFYKKNDDGWTPVHLVSIKGNLDIINWISAIIDLQSSHFNDQNSLVICACKNGAYWTAKFLIEGKYCNDSAVDENGSNLLHCAASFTSQNNSCYLLKYLVKNTSCDLFSLNKIGDMPIHTACRYGRLEFVKYLSLQMKTFPTMTNDIWFTAFRISIEHEHSNITNYLMKTMPCQKLDFVDKECNTVLHVACEFNKPELVERLFTIWTEDECSTIVKHKNVHNQTSFTIACLKGFYNVLSIFTNFKFKIPDWEVLNKAHENNSIDIVSYLIATFKHDAHGRTALQYASHTGNLNLVSFLTMYTDVDIFEEDKDQRTALHHACIKGHLSIVQYFMDKYEFLSQDSSPVCYASEMGHLNIVKFFAENYHHSLTYVDSKGMNLYHYACMSKNPAIIKYLIKNNYCESKQRSHEGFSIIHTACKYGNIEIVKFLVDGKFFFKPTQWKVGFDSLRVACQVAQLPDRLNCIVDNKGHTPLHIACKYGHLEIVKYLSTPSSLRCIDNNGYTLLHTACRYSQLEMVKHFSANVDTINILDKEGCNPFLVACHYGDLDVIKFLVGVMTSHSTSLDLNSRISGLEEYNKMYNIVDKNGLTALHHACYNSSIEVMKCLLETLKFTLSSKDKSGMTAYHYACSLGHIEAVKIVHLNYKESGIDNNGHSGLHHASKEGHLNVVKHLVSNEKEIFLTDFDGNTPLHIAVRYNRVSIVKYFIENDYCDIKLRGENGRTPLVIAAFYQCSRTFDYLFLEHKGCNPLIKDNSGHTVLRFAYQWKWEYVVNSMLASSNYSISCRDFENKALLYSAIEEEQLEAFKYILESLEKHKDCNPSKILEKYRDSLNGNTALHLVSIYGRLETAKYLIKKKKIQSNILNSKNQTCLHLASMHGHLSIVKFMSKNSRYNPESGDIFGKSSLHYAAEYGQLQVIEYFIGQLKLNSELKDSATNTPLHLASEHGHKECVIFLLGHTKSVVYNIDDDSPLHLTCKNGHFDVFEVLLTSTKYDIYVRNKKKKSIVDYAQDKPDMARHIREIYGTETTLIPKIFVIGFPGAGKSTLVKALQKESGVRIFNVSQVVPHTIGVTPTEFHSKMYGTVQLYDFAGDEEYHANHQLLFQNAPLPIILILTDLTLNEEDVLSNIRYWIKLLINSLTNLNFKSSASIFIVGSHYDLIQGKKQEIIGKLELKINQLLSKLLPEEINCAKILFGMNCQKPKSDGIDKLRAQIKLSCVLCRAEIVKLVPYKISLMCQKVLKFIN